MQNHALQRAFPRLLYTDSKFIRNASLTSAINRGIRKGASRLDRIGTSSRRPDQDGRSDARNTPNFRTRSDTERRDTRSAPPSRARFETDRRDTRNATAPRTRFDIERRDTSDTASPRTRHDADRRDSRSVAPSRNRYDTERRDSRNAAPPRTRYEIERREQPDRFTKRKWGKDKEPQSTISYEAPQGVPYTQAGSEFLYGTFAVKAALEAKRRRVHKLYVWKGERTPGDDQDDSIVRLARSKRIRVEEVAGTWNKMLMRMSGQRPHNGYVLEAAPIPKLPIATLGRMEVAGGDLIAVASSQSAESEMMNKVFQIDDNLATIPRISPRTRYPLLLWLDRITDSGNLGAIIRTAYFFGVDAIMIPEHGTAPFAPATIKASAGTAEYLPILTVKKEVEFVKACREKGWKFFAAVAPQSASTKNNWQQPQSDSVADVLESSPCVLMVGNEGEGLRGFMQKAADESISIEGGHNTSAVVDSLNVSVAAALLMARFLSPSQADNSSKPEPPESTETTGSADDSNMF